MHGETERRLGIEIERGRDRARPVIERGEGVKVIIQYVLHGSGSPVKRNEHKTVQPCTYIWGGYTHIHTQSGVSFFSPGQQNTWASGASHTCQGALSLGSSGINQERVEEETCAADKKFPHVGRYKVVYLQCTLIY